MKKSPIIPVLLKYSQAKEWKDAKPEWVLNHIEYLNEGDQPETCSCGHFPIMEVCYIENVVNGTSLVVGNCCINQVSQEFEPLKRLFPAIREKRINPALIDYARKMDIITDWEKGFLESNWRKRSLSSKQSKIWNELHKKIFEAISKNGVRELK